VHTHMKKARTKTYVPVIFEDCCSYVITVSGVGGADADAPMKMRNRFRGSDEQPSGEGSLGRPTMGRGTFQVFLVPVFLLRGDTALSGWMYAQ